MSFSTFLGELNLTLILIFFIGVNIDAVLEDKANST
jgi:hypothetical protein